MALPRATVENFKKGKRDVTILNCLELGIAKKKEKKIQRGGKLARYEHLNIYKAAYAFLIYFGAVFPHFQREYRYTIGESLLNQIMDFIIMIYKANSAKTKEARAEILTQMQIAMEYINVKLRLAVALRALSMEKYNNCCVHTQDIDMQLSGWVNYTLSQTE